MCGSLRQATPAQLTSCSSFRALHKTGPVHPAPMPPQPSRQPSFLSGAGSGGGPLRLAWATSHPYPPHPPVSTQQAAIHKACPQRLQVWMSQTGAEGLSHTPGSPTKSSCLKTKGSEPSYRAAHEPKIMKRDVQKPPKPEKGSTFPRQLPGGSHTGTHQGHLETVSTAETHSEVQSRTSVLW